MECDDLRWTMSAEHRIVEACLRNTISKRQTSLERGYCRNNDNVQFEIDAFFIELNFGITLFLCVCVCVCVAASCNVRYIKHIGNRLCGTTAQVKSMEQLLPLSATPLCDTKK